MRKGGSAAARLDPPCRRSRSASRAGHRKQRGFRGSEDRNAKGAKEKQQEITIENTEHTEK
jgi:hypothetical protein